jgi:hypothetical protein
MGWHASHGFTATLVKVVHVQVHACRVCVCVYVCVCVLACVCMSCMGCPGCDETTHKGFTRAPPPGLDEMNFVYQWILLSRGNLRASCMKTCDGACFCVTCC